MIPATHKRNQAALLFSSHGTVLIGMRVPRTMSPLDVLDMHLCGCFGDHQRFGYFSVGSTRDDECGCADVRVRGLRG